MPFFTENFFKEKARGTLIIAFCYIEKPNDNVEQLKRAGIEDENTLFFAACNSDEQSLARMHIEQLRLQKQKSGKSLTELAVTSDREQLPEDDEINEDIYPIGLKILKDEN